MKKILLALAAGFLCFSSAYAQEQSFSVWLEGVKKDARQQGISQATIDDALTGIEPIDRVIELDGKQPEHKLTMEEYLAKTISNLRIKQGRENYAANRELLDSTAKKYGVPASIIVSLWGIETSYGDNTGGFSTVASLATLAYDGRRADFFRGELFNALWILDAEHMKSEELEGSWAGALGQCQFMPSSFMKYAVDGDGDGHRDIWNSNADIFASIANYLHSEGWDEQGDVAEGSNNFKVLLKWNRSRYFATAVGNLAAAIKE